MSNNLTLVMMIEVTPPIHERTTKQLLSIAGAPHKWQPQVVEITGIIVLIIITLAFIGYLIATVF